MSHCLHSCLTEILKHMSVRSGAMICCVKIFEGEKFHCGLFDSDACHTAQCNHKYSVHIRC